MFTVRFSIFNSMLRSATALALVPAFVSVAHAEESVSTELETIVVSATRSSEKISSIPGTVQVIEKEELEEKLRSSVSLNEFLGKYVAGLTGDNGTLAGSGQTFRGRSVQVLVNGSPRNIALRNNSRMLSLIDPNSIERIEIINGASGIYGDGGTGGIVNIITKKAADEGLRGFVSEEISTSEHSLIDGAHTTTSGELAYGKGNFGLIVNGRIKTTGDMFDGDGDRVPEDPMVGQGGGSGIKQFNISGQGNYEGDQFDVSLYGSWVYLDQDLDYFSNYQTDPVSLDESQPYTGKPTHENTKNIGATVNFYDFALGDVQLDAYFNDSEKRASYVPADPISNPLVYSAPGQVQSDDAQSVLFAKQAGLRSTVKSDLSFILEGAQLNWGLDYSYNDITQTMMDGTDIIAPMEQHAYAGFAQFDIPLGDMIDIRAGVRHERYNLSISDYTRPAASYLLSSTFIIPVPAASVTGADVDFSATVFNAGIVLHPHEALDLFANFSQGYSVPDVGAFTRRAVNPLNPYQTSFDYSDLAPDAAIVNNYEIGARFENDRIKAAFSAFMSTSDKGTNITADALTMSQQKERIYGAELKLDVSINEAWNAGAVLAYTEGRWDEDGDGTIDDDLPNSRIGAPFRSTFFTSYRFDNGISLYGEALFTSARDANDGGNRQLKLKPTFTVNSRVSYKRDWGEFHLGVDNILDRKQMNVTASSLRNTNILGEGRRIYAGLRKQF